ncbi:porin [Mannheimia sp. AT1]|uniref:Porin n=1 Tax=Mannheimia cairinae TaxID=3025936 RepID=A0ABT5MN34_9PAST|nr:porin [Mannheimia cairinae]MDD0823585.1 porin [Mannheimia cairinae]MDD0825483.1 porin [Mannheimia cairinae]
MLKPIFLTLSGNRLVKNSNLKEDNYEKTLLALSIAAMAASGANATVVYQQDGTKIDVDGRVALEVNKAKDKRTDVIDRGSRVRVRAFQEIGGGYEAVAATELRFSDANSLGGNVRAHRLFGGVQHKDIGSLTFGRQLVLGDHIPKANYTWEMGGNVFLDAHTKAFHFMSAKFNGVRVAADYYVGHSDKTRVDTGNGFQFGLFYDGELGDAKVRFGSGYGELTAAKAGAETRTCNATVATLEGNTVCLQETVTVGKEEEFKRKFAGVGFDVNYGIVTAGLDWAYAKSPKGQAFNTFQTFGVKKFEKINRFDAGLKVAVTPQNNIYGGVLFGTAQNDGEAKAKNLGWKLGVDHKFNKYVAVYLEGGKARTKQSGKTIEDNSRIGLGTRITF